MSFKILYIHGFGGTGNSLTAQRLQKVLADEAIIYAPQFSNDLGTVAKIEKNIAEAKKHILEFCPDMVVATSFGGFIATFLHGYPHILINPCLLPSERLSTLSPNMTTKEIEKLKVLEIFHDIDAKICNKTYGLFGLDDELFSYLSLFKKRYGESKAYTMRCGHRIDLENIKNHLVPIVLEVKKKHARTSFR